ncbi:MAG: head GIN domain-containing protein [Pirellulaceae bacterium]|nr:head GIN domain-containing protein [Pirellulaceae bacterium]
MTALLTRSMLILSGLVGLSGCVGLPIGIQGSGVAKTETREVDSFHALRLDAVGDVTIQIGQPQDVQVTFDDNLLEILETSVVDGELRIKTTDSYNSSVGLKIQVTVPSIDALKLTGVGSVQATGIDGESLTIQQSGVGKLKVDGKVKSVELNVSGVGSADLQGLQAETAKVVVSGVGGASVFASQSIDAKTSGVGGIKVYGNPVEKKIKSSGIGTISYE